ncbi:hypothetical protein P7K49_006473 [Saguinus oedipus]|uniref:Uncharacterized protein n=1 Tax=Saguinus oedipus TaxID=9490 RepID=A0ABQ9W2H9_SAGOE|nr:hypothetical protein P7K49_006473 [Saguinus oedipus]
MRGGDWRCRRSRRSRPRPGSSSFTAYRGSDSGCPSPTMGAAEGKARPGLLPLLLLAGAGLSAASLPAAPRFNVSLDAVPELRWLPVLRHYDLDLVRAALGPWTGSAGTQAARCFKPGRFTPRYTGRTGFGRRPEQVRQPFRVRVGRGLSPGLPCPGTSLIRPPHLPVFFLARPQGAVDRVTLRQSALTHSGCTVACRRPLSVSDALLLFVSRDRVPRWVHVLMGKVVLELERFLPQPFTGEIRGMCDFLNLSLADCLLVNLAYESSA